MTEPRDIMKELAQNPPETDDGLGLPTLEFNYERYRKEIDKFDVTDEQAKEFLSTLFYIVHTLVDIDMGLDVTQMFNQGLLEKPSQDSGNTILLEQSVTSFNEAAHTTTNKQED
jgi:hypothetical protein